MSTLADLSRRVRVADGLEIKSTYKSFNTTAIVLLATSGNPDLCVDIVHVLPFTVFRDYAVIGGESMCAWTPAYGEVTEDIEPPELGEALLEFEQAPAWVGHCVLKSIFETKETILLMVNLAWAKQRVGT
jgi:hypothetical protein